MVKEIAIVGTGWLASGALWLANADPTANLFAPLIGQGVTGVMLVWFMFRNETRLKALENSQDQTSHALFALLVKLDPDNTALKEAKERNDRRIDAKHEKR